MTLLSVPLALAAAATGVFSWRLASSISKRFVALGITGVDIHKLDRPVRAEMGGLSVLLALSLGSMLLVLLGGVSSFVFMAGVTVLLLTGLVGLGDDWLDLRQRDKALLVFAASFVLSSALMGSSTVYFPVFGTIPFGGLFPLLVVPLSVTTAANFSNMLAGFNGLEAGIAAISIAVMTSLSALTGSEAGALLGSILLFAYLGFLALNWYPAKLFPGDTGTLMFGAGVAAIGLIAGLEIAAIVLLMPAALDFALKMTARNPFGHRKVFGNTRVGEDGVLVPAGYPALVHAFMRVAPTSERTLVASVLAMEACYAALAFAVTLVHF